MHEHQLQILERINHIMTAFEDLTREVQEMEEKINEALVKIQEFIDQILANPADVAAVTAAAQRLDELQTQITNALAQIPPATPPVV
jgi:Na+/phosphate symporter